MTDQTAIISDTTCKQQQQLLQQQQQLPQQQQLLQQPQQQQQQQQQQEQQSHDHHVENYHASPVNGSQKDEKGYTVVPASVSFRGVSMKLDLKIDQKTLAAATNFSKVVEEAVSTHLSSSVIPVENNEVGSSLIPHIPPTCTATSAQSYHSVSSFTVMEPANSTKESPICDSSVESSTALLGRSELCEQVNEVCSSTVDASPFCDTACSPIQLELQTKLPHGIMSSYMKSPDDTPPASSEEQNRIASHSMVKEELTDLVTNTAAPDNIYLTPCASTSSAEVDAAAFSPLLAKRRKEKSTTASHLCEQIDAEKGQACSSFIVSLNSQKCRQRAIVNYRYCIRHILLDPEAPYIQCQHQRKRDTNLLCTNAVRKDKGTIYCSTHLIMNGLMEPRKKKAKTGAVIVESTELTSSCNNNIWNRSAITGKSSLTTALSPALVDTYEEMNCMCCFEVLSTSRTVEQTCIRNDGVVYNNVLNSAVIAVDSVTNKRTVYHFSKTSVASTLPIEGGIVTVATESRNEVTTAYDDSISIEDDEYTGLPKLPVHKTIMSLPVTSSYGGVRSTYDCPVQATTSQVVRRNLPQLYPRTASQVVTPTIIKTRDGVQIPCSQSTMVKQRVTANLSKQHPQLAAKLLQAPASTAGQSVISSLSGASIRSNFAKSIIPPSLLVSEPRNLLPSTAPRLSSHQEPPRFYKTPDDDKIKSAIKQEKSDIPQKPKVIQLKQKRRRMKMTGIYRKIPQVDQMCRVLEDQDFDRTDLFPRGLEPSDDEDEENDYLDLRWSEMACNAVSDPAPQGALQVYLVKKQIRLDKNALMKEAVTNAPIMHACKQYPNSVGAALADRASNYGTAASAAFNQKKCTITILKGGSPPVQCTNNCLPFSNHCAQHISYNLNQKLFSYCAEPCCSQPVLCVDAPKTLKLCVHHYELRKKKKAEEELARGNAHQSWKQQTSICYVQQQPMQPYEDDIRMNIQHSHYQSQDIATDRIDSVGVSDFCELEMGSASSGNESDVYLASFAKDLEFNFDGREINDMLANFNVADGESADILHDQPFSDGVKDEFLQLPTEFNEMAGGHNWLDVEQFLISEGVDLSSSSQSSSISAVSVPQPLSLANDNGVTFCEFSSSSSSHQPRN
uniref:NSL complex protein NSL2 n=1 Tax=Elaeophora elaphi TaxID=1147741 RepID=A0A0R3S1E0_9BILA